MQFKLTNQQLTGLQYYIGLGLELPTKNLLMALLNELIFNFHERLRRKQIKLKVRQGLCTYLTLNPLEQKLFHCWFTVVNGLLPQQGYAFDQAIEIYTYIDQASNSLVNQNFRTNDN